MVELPVSVLIDFQLRIAHLVGANHLAVSFGDPELEKERRLVG
jgi:hypothetical protein